MAQAGRAHGLPVPEMAISEMRDLVRRMRHDAELLRLHSAMQAREALAVALRSLDSDLRKEVRWTSDRLIRHTEARDFALLKDLHLEVGGLQKSMARALRGACRSLRGKLLPEAPTALAESAHMGSLRKDQVRWLQGCCGVLFPHCLVCIYDPGSQDDVEVTPWTVLEALPGIAHAAPLAGEKKAAAAL